METIFVGGAWGSGTTALTGALARLGVTAFEPHLHVNDERTPNTFEHKPFRELILTYVDEMNLTVRPDKIDGLIPALKQFAADMDAGKYGAWPGDRPRRTVLKFPGVGLVMSHFVQAFDMDKTKIVIVTRPIQQIEASRRRRKWLEHLGQKGAKPVYARTFFDLQQTGTSYLAVSHRDLVQDTETTMKRVIAYCGLEDLAGNFEDACAFIRRE